MIDHIEVKGKLIHECSIDGERRCDDVYPGHPNGCQLSKNRWLIIYATRGWRSVDDDRSIIYQLHEDKPDGRLIKEGRIRSSFDEPSPDVDGMRVVIQMGHPGVFGVPKGAAIDGRPAPQANVFMARWRRNIYGKLDPKTGKVERNPHGGNRWVRVEQVPFRLNEANDDIEMLGPVMTATEKGFEEGSAFFRHGPVDWMNQNVTQLIPFNSDVTEWVGIDHFSGGQIAAVKYRFNPDSNSYDWVETGPMISNRDWQHIETSIVRNGDGWTICSRSDHTCGIGAKGWMTTPDPFLYVPEPVFNHHRQRKTPHTLYNCPDGEIRLFTSDPHLSTYNNPRNPLYCWGIDPNNYNLKDCIEVFDCISAGLLAEETSPKSEMCKLLPHGGGREQYLLWRVRVMNVDHIYHDLPPVTDEMKPAHGIYYAVIHYDEDLPGLWTFE